MNYKIGLAEAFFSNILSHKKALTLVTSTQWRKRKIQESWRKYISEEKANAFFSLQKLKIHTINEYVIKKGRLSNEILISPNQQEIIIQQIMKAEKNYPGYLKHISSLPVLFRKAYSIREFNDFPLLINELEKVYQQIHKHYLQTLFKYGLTDSEQMLKKFTRDHRIDSPDNLLIEYFPSGTQRVNYLYNYFDKQKAVFLIPETFQDIRPGVDQSFAAWKGLLGDWIINHPLSLSREYDCYANEIEEISAQFDYLEKNPETGLIMADPGNYRRSYEQIGVTRELSPSISRKSLLDAPNYQLIKLIVSTALDADSIELKKGFFSDRFRLKSFAEIEQRTAEKILKKIPLIISRNRYKDLNKFMNSGNINTISWTLSKRMTPEEIKIMPVVWDKISDFFAQFLPISSNETRPDQKLHSILRILSQVDLLSNANPLIETNSQIIRRLQELAHFYTTIKVKKIGPWELVKDINNWFLEKTHDFFPYYRSYELWGIEDAKNIPAHKNIWISGFSLDAFPPKFSEHNFLITAELQDQIARLRYIEQKAVLMQLIERPDNKLQISYAKIVNGTEKTGALLLNDSTRISHISDFYSPFNRALFSKIKPQLTEDPEPINRFSATSFNTYLKCPHKFYWKYISQVEEPDEISEDLRGAEIGNIIHKILQQFFADNKTIELLNDITDPDQSFLAARPLLSSHINGVLKNERKVDDGINARTIDYWTRDYQSATQAPGRIYLFIRDQINYFYAKRQNEEPLKGALKIETEAKIEIPVDTIIFSGKIDRIDSYDASAIVEIWDYKTSSKNALVKEEQELKNIQREFYTFIARKRDPHQPTVINAYYQPLKDDKFDPVPDSKTQLRQTIEKEFKSTDMVNDRLLRINKLWHRIISPWHMIEARLENRNLETVSDLRDFEDEIDPVKWAHTKTVLINHLKEFDQVNEKLFVWLAGRVNRGPYPGYVTRDCGFCGYRNLCRHYWKIKQSGNDADEE